MNYLNTTHRSVAWFKKAADSETLDMTPPFQRMPVWTERQKAFLIDTIVRGYPVPELYVQDIVDDKGNERHVVVDGQQRIRACLEFVEGSFEMNGEDSPDYAGFSFDDLPTDIKKRVFEYQFVIRMLPEVTDQEIRAIFGRLNRNTVALNAQELRHATYWGPFIRLMEGLTEIEFWHRSGVFSPNDVRRMLDVEFVSELTVGILHGAQNKKASLEKWYEVYEEHFEEESEVRQKFQAVCGEIGQILPDISSTRWRKKSDCYTVFLVFAGHADQLPLSRSGRHQAGIILKKLATEVDLFLHDPTADVRSAAKAYAAAVQRAASDLKNRLVREEVLERDLSTVWGAEAGSSTSVEAS